MENNGFDLAFDLEKISEEEYAKELAAKREKRIAREEARIKNLKIRRKACAKLAGIVLAGSLVTTGIITAIAYNTQPINIAASEIVNDTGLAITDNGRKIHGEMTDEELIAYIKENNLSVDELREKIEKRFDQMGVDVEFGMEKAMNANPEVFESEGKGMGK